MTRSLSPRERAALDALLSADFAGVVVDLGVDESLPVAVVAHRVPVQAVVDGEGYDGGLILFVDEGRLSGLEYWWVTDDKPHDFPPTSVIGNPVVTKDTLEWNYRISADDRVRRARFGPPAGRPSTSVKSASHAQRCVSNPKVGG